MKLPGKPSRWVLAGLCVLSIVLMLLGERPRWLCRCARPVLVPLSHLGTKGVVHLRVRIRELTRRPPSEHKEHLEALEQELLKWQEINDGLKEDLAAVSDWHKILYDRSAPNAPPTEYTFWLIGADIIGGEALPLHNRKLLGAGSRHGLARGDLAVTRRLLHPYHKALPRGLTVLGRSFVVGKIRDAAGYSATLQLVTDPGYHSAARILRLVRPGQRRTIEVKRPADVGGGLEPREFRHNGRTRGPQIVGGAIDVFAKGDGREIVCRNLPAHHRVRPGDVLTTAKAAGLPFRLRIGRVHEVKEEADNPLLVTAYVEPLADLAALREVYIVLPVDRRKR